MYGQYVDILAEHTARRFGIPEKAPYLAKLFSNADCGAPDAIITLPPTTLLTSERLPYGIVSITHLLRNRDIEPRMRPLFRRSALRDLQSDTTLISMLQVQRSPYAAFGEETEYNEANDDSMVMTKQPFLILPDMSDTLKERVSQWAERNTEHYRETELFGPRRISAKERTRLLTLTYQN